MRKIMKTLAVIATVTLTAGTANAAQSAMQLAIVSCGDPFKTASIGFTSSPYPSLRGISCYEWSQIVIERSKWINALEEQLNQPRQTGTDLRSWQESKYRMAIGCAIGVIKPDSNIRSANGFRAAAVAAYNSVMSRRYTDEYTVDLGNCG